MTIRASARKSLTIMVAITVLGLLFCSVYRPVVLWLEFHSFSPLHDRMVAAMDRLQLARPEGINDQAWENAFLWTNSACHNVCYSPEHVRTEAMRAFVESLEQKVATDVDRIQILQ